MQDDRRSRSFTTHYYERRRTEEDAKHSQNAGKPKKKQNPASELYTARSRVMQLLDEAQIKIFREP